MLNIVKQLVKISPRQFEGELKARKFIVEYLNKLNILFRFQTFDVRIPRAEKYSLTVDGKKIPCLPCSFQSGKIEGKEFLSNPLRDSGQKDKKAIIFNPLGRAISLHTYYFLPALSVSRDQIPGIIKAKSVLGKVDVKMRKYRAVNILIGNTRDPQNIIFAHYDSLETGATDNACGTAVVMEFIKRNGTEKNLFVLSGCEELSHEKPVYWGYGYRFFEKKYSSLLRNCRCIVVVDSVGNGKTIVFNNDPETIRLGFPVKNAKKLQKKIFLLTGDIKKLMTVYHSKDDDMSQIKKEYLKDAYQKLKFILSNN